LAPQPDASNPRTRTCRTFMPAIPWPRVASAPRNRRSVPQMAAWW
jgi:hypothetical protein